MGCQFDVYVRVIRPSTGTIVNFKHLKVSGLSRDSLITVFSRQYANDFRGWAISVIVYTSVANDKPTDVEFKSKFDCADPE